LLQCTHEGSSSHQIRSAGSGPDIRSEKPTAEDNGLLIKVHATTVNRTGCGFWSSKPFFSRFFTGLVGPKGTVMGHGFCGRVEAVGSDVTSLEIGDRVFGFIGFSGPFGAHAKYVTIPEDGPLATILANLTYEEAAPSTEGSHHALANSRKARIRSADRVIDYTAEDFTKDDQEYEAVLDAVGKSSFGRCRQLLKPGGIYLLTEGSPVPDLGTHHSVIRWHEGHVCPSEA
jgi:NADPH:quinone reductase-like Zn-dependent oxidoreductase